jgi:hypothetical protein
MSSRFLLLVDIVVCATLLGACSAGEQAVPTSSGGRTTTGSTGGQGGGSNTGGDPTGGGSGTATGGTGNGGGFGGGITTTTPDASLDRSGDSCSSIRSENEVVVTTETKVVQSPVDLYFIVDHSGSMDTTDPGNTQTRWQAQSQALNLFIDQSTSDAGVPVDAALGPDGSVVTQGELGVGLGWFPITTGGGTNGNSSCVLTDYVPVVPIANLPGNAPPLKAAIAGMTPNGRTPTRMAMEGAVQYTTGYQAANPKRRVAIVLATDGIPNDCQSTVPAVAAVAQRAFMGTPPISTYVLGVGPETGNLDQIAQAGGTNAAYMVTNSGAAALLAALNAIRTQVTTTSTTTMGTKIACSQKLDPSQRDLDWAAARMTREVNKTSVVVPPVANLAACGTSEGWYYDDPKMPTQLVFCPATCDALTPEAGLSKIAIDIPCNIPKRPPS